MSPRTRLEFRAMLLQLILSSGDFALHTGHITLHVVDVAP